MGRPAAGAGPRVAGPRRPPALRRAPLHPVPIHRRAHHRSWEGSLSRAPPSRCRSDNARLGSSMTAALRRIVPKKTPPIGTGSKEPSHDGQRGGKLTTNARLVTKRDRRLVTHGNLVRLL